MGDWGNPLRAKQPKAAKPPKAEKRILIPKFKPEPLTLTKSEAKKFLNHSPSRLQTAWCQRWLQQLIRERTLPPQLAGADGYGQFCSFLSPDDCLKVLEKLRADFVKTLPLEVKGEFDFLRGLGDLEAYHEHLLQLHTSDHNSHSEDDDL